MALSDRKIPILTGINDVPTTDGDAKHPNASLLCANYNALIDDVQGALDNIGNSSGSTVPTEIHDDLFTIYVDSVNGNDNNNGLTLLAPVLTIQKAIDLVSAKKINKTAFIKLTGEFTQADPLDFSAIYGNYTSDGYGYRDASTLILDRESTNNWTFNYNNNDLALLISSPNVIVEFNYCTLNCLTTLLLRNNLRTVFRRITFNTSSVNGDNSNGCLSISGGHYEFFTCTFNKLNDCFYGLNAEIMARVLVDTCTFNNFDSAIQASKGSHIYHRQGSFVNCNISFEGNDCGFIQTRTEPNRDKIQMDSGSCLVTYQKFYTNANNYGSAIANATTGTEITTINNILTALRNLGIVPSS